LKGFCKEHNWVYSSGKRVKGNYVEYLNRTKISINLCRFDTMRTHRVFDSMACGCCLVTSPIAFIAGEEREENKHYLVFRNYDLLAKHLMWLMEGNWKGIAEAGKALVDTYHTWDVRAKELYTTLVKEFPWLGS